MYEMHEYDYDTNAYMDEDRKLWEEYFIDGDITTKVLENKKYVDKVISRPVINLKYEIIVTEDNINEKRPEYKILETFDANKLDDAVLRLVKILQEYVHKYKNNIHDPDTCKWYCIYLVCKCDQLKHTWKLSEDRSKRINEWGLGVNYCIYLENIHNYDGVPVFNDHCNNCLPYLVHSMDSNNIPFRKIGGYDETDYRYDED